jgi:ATP-dependent helicase/nuclease subunit B
MINFIYGDPGTGKTEAIFNKLAEDAKAKKNALVIVPEQMTVSMERDVLKRLSPSAQLYIEVVNFTRLANKLFREHGGITYNYATPAVQKLIMWQAVKSAAPFLSEYKIGAGDNNALADAMLATYKELYASGISFEDLDKLSLESRHVTLSQAKRYYYSAVYIFNIVI